MFADRTDAGRQLGAELVELGPWLDAVVLGIPRGGVVVAAEVARALGLPLDIVASAKVTSPRSPEFAIGALSADGVVHVNRASGFSAGEVEAYASSARAKVAHTLADLRGGRPAQPIEGKAALLVDDGLATGLTALAAVEYLQRNGAEMVVLAAPVASESAFDQLETLVDRLVVLEVPPGFSAVGQFYREFGQTEDAEVIALMAEAYERTRGAADDEQPD